MNSYLEEVQTALQNDDQGLAARKAKECLEKLDQVLLNIAITGVTGSGKSTFVNALRGVDNSDEDAAPTGVVETTMDPTEYSHPHYPNVKIWDLPGVGTSRLTASQYLSHVGFEKFDFFIIVSDTRFSENDAKLAQEIQRMKKKFYFVRSKIDNNINNGKRTQRYFNEENVLKLIRDNCVKELRRLRIEFPKIFLVSSFELHLYEFNALWETLERELPQHQRDVLLLSLSNISLNFINQKKKALEDKITWRALASALGAAVPIPGTSLLIDLTITIKFVIECQSSLGLTGESLLRISKSTDVPIEDLKAELKSPLAGVRITQDLVVGVLRVSVAFMTAVGAEQGSRFIPGLGIPVAMSLSAFVTFKALDFLLNSLAEDAQRVFTKVISSSV